MSDDASYTAFLNKANADSSASSKSAPPKPKPKPNTSSTASSSTIPAPLASISSYSYTSETDSAFAALVLPYDGASLPSTSQFAKCIDSAPGKVEELSVEEFDPRGEYSEVVAKVEEVGEGGLKVFRVEVGTARAEYYIVALASGGEKGLVGVKCEAVES